MLQQLQAVQFPSSLPQNPQYSQAPLPQPQGQGMFLRNSNSSSNSGGNGGGGGGPPTAAAVQPRVEIIRDGIDKKRFYTKDTKSESQAHLLVKIHGYGNVQATSVSFDAYAVRLDDTPISKDRKEKKTYVKVIESRFVESDSWLIDVKMTEGTLKSLAKFYIIATLTLVDVHTHIY